MEEVWKEIPGHEGRYEASSLGRIRFVPDGHILSCHIEPHGYVVTSLCKDGKHRPIRVHIIIARTFLPNPDNLPCINHKDEDKTNNRVDNLEWCTQAYNINYGSIRERMSANSARARAVDVFDKSGRKVAEYSRVGEAADALGVTRTYITKCASGRRKTCKGMVIRYAASKSETSKEANRLALERYPINVDGFVERERKRLRAAYAAGYDKAIRNFYEKISQVKDIPESIQKVIDDNFWEML